MMQFAAFAQTLIPPFMADMPWVTPAAVGCGINTAVIDYPVTGDPNFPFGRLGACAYGGPGGVVVTDLNMPGFSVNTTYPVFGPGASGNTMAGCPDVILGNDLSSPTPAQDFIMAVAFVVNVVFPAPPLVEIDYYNIHYLVPGPGPFTVTPNSFQIIPVAMPWTPIGTVHLDVVAQNSMLIPYGMPLCDQFFVTYDATTPAPVYNVFATFGRLNLYNALLAGPQNISFGALPTVDSWQPDVAGVERPVAGGGTHPVASIVHVCQCNNMMWYQEWDPIAAIVTPPNPIGPLVPCLTPGVYVQYSRPRIDANDDYLTNTNPITLIPYPCQYQAVCEYLDTTTFNNNDVRVYGPAGGTMESNWINLWWLPPFGTYSPPGPFYTYNHYCPTVAFGPNAASEYIVTECANLPLIPGVNHDFFMMSPMNMCGTGLAPSPGGPAVYFEVNTAWPATSSNYANSSSTPCNNVSDISLIAWTDAGNINYKMTQFIGPNGYNFRTTHGGTTASPPSAITQDRLAIYPLPANDHITIDNPASNNADRYSIKNVLGQIVADGSLVLGKQKVNVSSLTDGNYIISVFREGVPAGNTMFVKK